MYSSIVLYLYTLPVVSLNYTGIYKLSPNPLVAITPSPSPKDFCIYTLHHPSHPMCSPIVHTPPTPYIIYIYIINLPQCIKSPRVLYIHPFKDKHVYIHLVFASWPERNQYSLFLRGLSAK